MKTEQFLEECRKKVIEYYEENGGLLADLLIQTEEIFTVWYSKTLQNHKCCMGTTVKDNLYFEFTYNGDKNQLYMDVYDKLKNICFNYYL